jgi:hypothetical protein
VFSFVAAYLAWKLEEVGGVRTAELEAVNLRLD